MYCLMDNAFKINLFCIFKSNCYRSENNVIMIKKNLLVYVDILYISHVAFHTALSICRKIMERHIKNADKLSSLCMSFKYWTPVVCLTHRLMQCCIGVCFYFCFVFCFVNMTLNIGLSSSSLASTSATLSNHNPSALKTVAFFY